MCANPTGLGRSLRITGKHLKPAIIPETGGGK
jgi:hypothetical protein